MPTSLPFSLLPGVSLNNSQKKTLNIQYSFCSLLELTLCTQRIHHTTTCSNSHEEHFWNTHPSNLVNTTTPRLHDVKINLRFSSIHLSISHFHFTPSTLRTLITPQRAIPHSPSKQYPAPATLLLILELGNCSPD
jgi:hypothetical protein